MNQIKWYTLCSVFLLFGCRNAYILSSWKQKDTRESKYSQLLVSGILHDKDLQLQEKMENHMAGDLRSLGYNVITSIAKFGPNAFCEMTEEQVLDKLKKGNVEAVITIVLLDKKIEKQYLPINWKGNSNQDLESDFWSYYQSVTKRIFEPGYYMESTLYFWESNFYDLQIPSRLYSIRTKSFNPKNTESLAHDYSKIIIKNMLKNKLIKKNYETPKKGF